ncbi:MAG: hypothetical protein HOM97_00235 [Nitrospina sp.]|nr:hypothetical protein [Nitrospina sp.]
MLHKNLMIEIQQRKEAESSMLKAKQEAEKANLAKSTFLSQMSHELRTPLNSILGFSQLMQIDSQNPLNGQQNENLNHVISAGKHLLELINEVLDLAKIEAGKITLKMTPVLIQNVVNEVVTLSQPATLPNNISLNISGLDQPDLFINGDYLRIKQILLNLISNAIKFNKPNGSVDIHFSVVENEKLMLRVEDTGSGFSPENLLRLFTPFERFDTGNTNIKGTGIGLTISKKLAQAMNGDITVTSTLGEGSTFPLELLIVGPTPIEPPAK